MSLRPSTVYFYSVFVLLFCFNNHHVKTLICLQKNIKSYYLHSKFKFYRTEYFIMSYFGLFQSHFCMVYHLLGATHRFCLIPLTEKGRPQYCRNEPTYSAANCSLKHTTFSQLLICIFSSAYSFTLGLNQICIQRVRGKIDIIQHKLAKK